MKYYTYCKSCSKRGDGTRLGEGYIVVAHKNGQEVTRPCTSCGGTGLIFVKEEELESTYDNTNNGTS